MAPTQRKSESVSRITWKWTSCSQSRALKLCRDTSPPAAAAGRSISPEPGRANPPAATRREQKSAERPSGRGLPGRRGLDGKLRGGPGVGGAGREWVGRAGVSIGRSVDAQEHLPGCRRVIPRCLVGATSAQRSRLCPASWVTLCKTLLLPAAP